MAKKYTVRKPDGTSEDFYETDRREQHLNLRSERDEVLVSPDGTCGDPNTERRPVSGDFLHTERDETSTQLVNATGYTETEYADNACTHPVRERVYERRPYKDANGNERFEFVKTADRQVRERLDHGSGMLAVLLYSLAATVLCGFMVYVGISEGRDHGCAAMGFIGLSASLLGVIVSIARLMGGMKRA